MQTTLIDFTLEITNGCQFNCTGCNVDKEGNSYPSEEEFDRLELLVDELNNNGFPAMNLAIGPTDIMTSFNKDKILLSERIKFFSQKFMKTAINCAFLDPFEENYIKLGKQLNWLLAGKMVKFVIPFEAFHIDNATYINKIRRRRDLVLSYMPDVLHTKTYLIINYEASIIYDREFNKNITEELILKMYDEKLFGDLHLDLILGSSRTNLREQLNSEKFIQSAKKLKTVKASAREKYGIKVDIAEIKNSEGRDWDIFYKGGKLYLMPFILEGLANFDEVFEVKTDWTVEGLYNSYNQSLIDQYDFAYNARECKNCQLIAQCSERGVHSLMQILNTEDCISPAKDIEHNISWTL